LVELGPLGFIGLLTLMFFTFKKIKKVPVYLMFIFISLAILMFFDHCFWDVRQSQYLLFLFIALISLYSQGKEIDK